MVSLRSLLGIDRDNLRQRRARALVKADRDLLANLVEIRKQRNLSQQDIADRLGISQSSVASFERYDNDPKLSTIRRYAHAVEALVAHAVEPDDGQLATSEHELLVTMTPVFKSTITVASAQQRNVSAESGKFSLALAA